MELWTRFQIYFSSGNLSALPVSDKNLECLPSKFTRPCVFPHRPPSSGPPASPWHRSCLCVGFEDLSGGAGEMSWISRHCLPLPGSKALPSLVLSVHVLVEHVQTTRLPLRSSFHVLTSQTGEMFGIKVAPVSSLRLLIAPLQSGECSFERKCTQDWVFYVEKNMSLGLLNKYYQSKLVQIITSLIFRTYFSSQKHPLTFSPHFPVLRFILMQINQIDLIFEQNRTQKGPERSLRVEYEITPFSRWHSFVPQMQLSFLNLSVFTLPVLPSCTHFLFLSYARLLTLPWLPIPISIRAYLLFTGPRGYLSFSPLHCDHRWHPNSTEHRSRPPAAPP